MRAHLFTRSKTLLIFALLMLAANTVFAEGGFRKPVVYLTFDDGPSADNATEDLLELTFFVTGQRANKEPEKISAILYAGHSLGNHSHTHVSLVSETREGIEIEFSKTNDAILAAGGPPLTCYRPPFGATDSVVKSVGSELGMALVKWSIDTRDWEPSVEGDRIIRTLTSVDDGPSADNATEDLLEFHESEQARVDALYIEKLTARIF